MRGKGNEAVSMKLFIAHCQFSLNLRSLPRVIEKSLQDLWRTVTLVIILVIHTSLGIFLGDSIDFWKSSEMGIENDWGTIMTAKPSGPHPNGARLACSVLLS